MDLSLHQAESGMVFWQENQMKIKEFAVLKDISGNCGHLGSRLVIKSLGGKELEIELSNSIADWLGTQLIRTAVMDKADSSFIFADDCEIHATGSLS